MEMKARTRIVVAVAVLSALSQLFLLPAEGETQFTNGAAITVPVPPSPASVPAPWPGSPYPSDITASGLAGTVTDVDVSLNGFDCSSRVPDFAYPEDIDLLLVGPTGANLVVLSDVGGANQTTALQFTDIAVTLDDEASSPPPLDAQLTAGTYRPADDDNDPDEEVVIDSFPSPAPPPSAATALSVFDGTDPNGTWSLHLVDDVRGPNNCSVLRGWTIDIATTADPTTTIGPTTSTTAPTTTTTMATTTTAAPTTTTSVPPPTQGEGVWKTTAPLSVPRYDHTTTLVANGHVLVAAGRSVPAAGAVELVKTAEVYDPRAERWRATGPLGDARWRHTATLLRDGRVLVAGGFGSPFTLTATGAGSNSQPVIASAEIYDPKTRKWSPTGSMATRRALHVATLLPNGKVLVAGGRTCNQPPPVACNFSFTTTTAEIYDPATGTWSPAGGLIQPRHTTSATLLANGKVLFPAGFGGTGSATNTAEVYDPASGTSVLTGNLNVARARHGTMPLPSGQVLVATGFAAANTAELYDPNSGTWTRTGSLGLVTARFNYNYAVLPNGKALVAGGATFPPASRPLTAEVFNPATGLWAPAGMMNDEHGSSSSLSNSQQAVVLSSSPWKLELKPEACAPNCGKALVAGNSPTGTVELYTSSCPSSLPRPPQQSWCVADGGAPGRPGAPGTPGETGPPEWTGAEEGADVAGSAGSPRTVNWG